MKNLHAHFEGKKHVIWDWNGTLLSDIEHAVESVNALLKQENLGQVTVDEYKKAFGFPVLDYYKRLGFNCEPESFKNLCERFNDYFYNGLHRCELWPGARETLNYVRASGRLQSVLSASEQNALNHSVIHYDVAKYFDHVVGIANKFADSKIERGRELIARVATKPDETVLIGDTDHDLEVGEALGIDVILVEHGHQCSTRLRAKHPKVIAVF
ncbi:MAG TPA: HAD hydrolase-like protein [Bdellovibrionales bacterium]|nr:HAD hydrolase-like protein [Bdellovibrionales bacterium]